MKILLLAFLFSATVFGSERTNPPNEGIELVGILSAEQGLLTIFSEVSTKTHSPLLKQGESWRGYRVHKINVDKDSVDVVKNDKTLTLYLKEARVKDGGRHSGAAFKILQGEMSKTGNRIVYSPGTILEIGPYKVSATEGSMQSEGSWLVGSLKLQTSTGAAIPAGSVGIEGGRVMIRGSKVSLPVKEEVSRPQAARPR